MSSAEKMKTWEGARLTGRGGKMVGKNDYMGEEGSPT